MNIKHWKLIKQDRTNIAELEWHESKLCYNPDGLMYRTTKVQRLYKYYIIKQKQDAKNRLKRMMD